jgi:hypothetical protein
MPFLTKLGLLEKTPESTVGIGKVQGEPGASCTRTMGRIKRHRNQLLESSILAKSNIQSIKILIVG